MNIQFLNKLRLLNFAFIVLLFSSACKKDDSNDKPSPTNYYLVNYELVKTIPTSSAAAAMTILSLQFPEASELSSGVKYDVDVYKITYKTHYKTEEIEASGLICVPNSGNEFPLISFQNGTNTLNSNAPSVNPNDITLISLESFASNGFIFIIPDYIGFGASSEYVHPYYVIEPTTNAVVDLIHATKEFLATAPVGAKYNGHNYLMGYSQGGWSTLAAFKRIETGTDSISINAASCGAGAYNLINTANYIAKQTTFPGPLYLPYYIYSHIQYGSITGPLSTFFNEPYASRIPSLFDGLHSYSDVNSQLNDTVSALLKTDLVTSLQDTSINNGSYSNLENDLINNSVQAWQLQGKLKLFHGNIDYNVPVFESQNIYSEFLKLNSTDKVEYIEMEGLSHETGATPWGIKTVLWFISLENNN